MGFHLQRRMLAVLGRKEQSDLISSHPINLEDVLDKAHLLDRQLVRYVDASQAATESWLQMCCASDKATVCGWNVQNSVFTTGDNVAVVAPQQVDPLRAPLPVKFPKRCLGPGPKT